MNPQASRPGESPAGGRSGNGPPSILLNGTSLVGLLLATGSLSSAIFFSIRNVWLDHAKPYESLIYLPLTALGLLGLALVAFGALREARHRARGEPPLFSGSITIELQRFAHGGGLVVVPAVMGIATFLVLGIGTGTADFVEFTESNDFCGQVCHAVMHPEATAHQTSPHANVQCVQCHVGEGAGSYMHSKLNGARQLYALVTGKIHRPIPTPLRDQRPAREICEACHWPSRFIGKKEIVRSYYRADEENSPIRLRMLVNIGGAPSTLAGEIEGSGIHYHMLLGHKVEYVARDWQRLQIPWVRVTHPDGDVEVYENSDEPLEDEERERLEIRQMDCLDCHNRPAHRFVAPVNSVNNAITTGLVSRELPFVKREAVRALDQRYDSLDAAMEGIERNLRGFYESEYPEIVHEKAEELERSVEAVKLLYRQTFFPEMRASWAAYPVNLGHRDSPGCFRCHNDTMESESGDTLFIDCQRCHLILAEGEDVDTVHSHTEAVPFWHPEDDDTINEFAPCTDCHDGGATLYED